MKKLTSYISVMPGRETNKRYRETLAEVHCNNAYNHSAIKVSYLVQNKTTGELQGYYCECLLCGKLWMSIPENIRGYLKRGYRPKRDDA